MNMKSDYQRPMPALEGMTAEFYDFCSKGELRFQRCEDCGVWRHVPRLMCADCGSWQWEWIESSGRGHLFTWTVVHRPMHPAFSDKLPYAPVVIELEEGVRMVSWVLDCPPEKLKRGMLVKVSFERVDESLCLPMFRQV